MLNQNTVKIRDSHFLHLINETLLDFRNVPAEICSAAEVKSQYGELIDALIIVKKTKKISLIEVAVIYQYLYESFTRCNANSLLMSMSQELYPEWLYMSVWIEKHFEVEISNGLLTVGGKK
jgi:hypothetical protein